MSQTVQNRIILTLFGAASGLAFWGLLEGALYDQVSERMLLVSGWLITVFTWGFFAMAGPLHIAGAVRRAVPLAVLVAGLVFLVSLRWTEGDAFFVTPAPFLASLAVAVLPVPFLIAEARGSLRDYPALFDITWAIIARGGVAVIFTGAVWAVIGISGLLLDSVGISLIEQILDSEGAALVVSGAAVGLGVAVVNELAAVLSPRLIHWLLRLLLPLVTLVSLVFVVALLLRGFDAGPAGMSPVLALLSMAVAGIILVTVALDQSDAEASASPVIQGSARVMAVLTLVLAALGLRAIWIRIAAEGATPNRVMILALVGIALAYGLVYSAALLRGRGFAGFIRRANPWLAFGVILVAALWMTPLFNAEAISARDQAQRVIDGRKPITDLTSYTLSDLGLAGEAARLQMLDHARASGDPAMELVAESLARDAVSRSSDEIEATALALRAQLATAMPASPPQSPEAMARFLSGINDWELEKSAIACQRQTGSGRPACLLLVADLMPERPGDEAMVIFRHEGWTQGYGLYAGEDGAMRASDLRRADGTRPTDEELSLLLESWSSAPPAVTPAPLNQFGSGREALLVMP